MDELQLQRIASQIITAKKKKKVEEKLNEFNDPDEPTGVEMSILSSVDFAVEFVLEDSTSMSKIKQKIRREVKKAIKDAVIKSLSGFTDETPRIGNISVSLRGGPNTL